MPLVQVSLRRGKSAEYHQALFEGVYRAMRETFDVPEDDRFMTITEHDAATFCVSPTYHGVQRSDEAVIIRITANNTRGLAQKRALYLRIAELLRADPGVRPEDVFINLVEVLPENWSLGHGLAQYAARQD
ncbi:tautomerase family protein [Bailinhaonella thermotolerans]|uniref:Tautomerase family protein n=1 Tax=Bailinhaonella thermotolerans TaxID=1070861 RepID=A0A3A4B455_9ACTN|nr:tautomerase family protein [Bailinhaonella thermotolerans]RJL35350.1 tautomerase family protein [Bailinhaonella thermotolerans]